MGREEGRAGVLRERSGASGCSTGARALRLGFVACLPSLCFPLALTPARSTSHEHERVPLPSPPPPRRLIDPVPLGRPTCVALLSLAAHFLATSLFVLRPPRSVSRAAGSGASGESCSERDLKAATRLVRAMAAQRAVRRLEKSERSASERESWSESDAERERLRLRETCTDRRARRTQAGALLRGYAAQVARSRVCDCE